MSEYRERRLSDWMLDQFALGGGLLHPVLVAVREDPELDLQIRDHYVNIYYRGSNLMEIRQGGRLAERLTAKFDKKYLPEFADNPWVPTAEESEVHEWLKTQGVLGRLPLTDREAVSRHLASFPYRKAAMDATRRRRPNWERQTQQEMVRLHGAADSEYLVCDIEYTFKYWSEKRRIGRIDMVAARRAPSAATGTAAKLVCIELKYGLGAIDGSAGLQKHVRDLHGLMKMGDVGVRAREMVDLVAQKRDLGLMPAVDLDFDLTAPVEYVIAVAHHNARSQRLRDALLGCVERAEGRLAWPDGVDARVAILGEDLLLRHDEMVACDGVTEDDMPRQIFSGRRLRDRTPRAARRGR